MNNILLPPVILLFVVVTLRTAFNIELCTPKDKKVGEIQLHIQEFDIYVSTCWSCAKGTISRHVLSRTQPNAGFRNYEDNIHSCYQLIPK